MLKRFFTAALLLIATLATWAQPLAGTFSLIPRVGVTISNLNKDAIMTDNNLSLNNKVKAGMMVGVEAEYQVAPSLALSLGAFYSEQGCKYDSGVTSVPTGSGRYLPEPEQGITNAESNLKYINVPLMLNLYVAENLALKVGAQVGFNVSGKMQYTATTFQQMADGTVNTISRDDYKQDIDMKKVDFSIPVGLSYEYMNVVVDARYNIGLSRAFNNMGSSSPKNSVIALSVGYRFTL